VYKAYNMQLVEMRGLHKFSIVLGEGTQKRYVDGLNISTLIFEGSENFFIIITKV